MSAQVTSSPLGPLSKDESADQSGLALTREGNRVDGWWTSEALPS
jgi:hypothetical protein